MVFYENYVRLAHAKGKTPSGAALEMGISKPTVNRWKNGGGATDATLLTIANYFGVTVEELTAETKKEPAPEGVELTDLQKEAMEFVLTLSDEELKQFIRIGEAMIEK